MFGLAAGLGASFFWALGAMLAHRPARHLGAFEFTRVQLVTCSLLLAVATTATDGWRGLSSAFLWTFIVSCLVGVVASNLAMVTCLRRGGPRRTQLLLAMSAPISTALSVLFLGESLSPLRVAGAALAMTGIVVAILFGARAERDREPVVGSLASMIGFGLIAAASKAIGLVVLKPALAAGVDPMAATALRTGGAAMLLSIATVWPLAAFAPATSSNGRMVLAAILPGILGYVVATALQLYALGIHETAIVAVLGSAAPAMILPMIWLATGQPPSARAWSGAALVVIGTILIALG